MYGIIRLIDYLDLVAKTRATRFECHEKIFLGSHFIVKRLLIFPDLYKIFFEGAGNKFMRFAAQTSEFENPEFSKIK